MYVRLKILPYNIYPKLPEDSTLVVRMRLRNDFGTMLQNHISPLWKNDEFDNLISLIQNPLARYMIHKLSCFPVLLDTLDA